MTQLQRITLTGIDSLVDEPAKTILVGEGSIKGTRWNKHKITVRTPAEKREIYNEEVNLVLDDRTKFLDYVESILADSGLYLSRVNYTPSRWGGFFPHKLSGKLHKKLSS